MNWILCIFIVLFSGCQQKSQENHYTEVVVQTPQVNTPSVPVAQTIPSDQTMPADPHAGLDMSSMALPPGMNSAVSNMFTWSAPQGWKQEAGGGMRLATFHLLSNTKAIDCSIVALGGMAGGLEANLRRWMGQIGVKATEDELSTLISSASSTKIKTGQGAQVFDFTTIQSKAQLTDKSMIVVMVLMDEATLFVKMAGTVDTVSKNKDDFFKLVGSIEYHAPSADTTSPGAEMNPTSTDPHAGLDMSAMGGIIDTPTSQNILAWGRPDGWTEEAGTHMRMVSFHPIADPNSIDCYIIALAGPAGGLEANLERWLGQLGLQPSDDNVIQLTKSAQILNTKDGLEVKVFDFTTLKTQSNSSDKSMIVAMIPVGQTTVFVKMMGSIESVKQNKDNFLKLLKSITRKQT
jgi:hypothetical protein